MTRLGKNRFLRTPLELRFEGQYCPILHPEWDETGRGRLGYSERRDSRFALGLESRLRRDGRCWWTDEGVEDTEVVGFVGREQGLFRGPCETGRILPVRPSPKQGDEVEN